MEQCLRLYDKAYPLYIGESIRKQFTETSDFKKIDELDGFIAISMCDYHFIGKHFSQMLLFDTAEHREKAGLILGSRGLDMRDVATSYEPVKLPNAMPVFADYRHSKTFRKELHDKLKLYNDKIYITKDELYKILDTVLEAVKKNKLALTDLYNLDELPLPNVSIVMGLSTYNFAVNQHEKTVMVEKYFTNDKLFKVLLEPTLKDGKLEVESNGKVIHISPLNMNDLKYSDTLDIFLAINFFIKHLPHTYQKSERKVEETIETGKGINKKYKRVVHLERNFNFVNLDKLSKTSIKHSFSCLCWGVRGHLRHLKSGKVVFVKPFKKGKERNNMEAFSEKEYRL